MKFYSLPAGALSGLACFAILGTPVAMAGEEADDGPDPRIGEEVDQICFGRNINGWRTVDKQDGVLLLERSVNNWYHVELSGACDYRVLRRAHAIGIDSRPAGGCVRRGDIIIVEDSPAFTRRCFIRSIRLWDDDAEAPGEDETED